MTPDLSWWNGLRHSGLLLDSTRLAALITEDPPRLYSFQEHELRRRCSALESGTGDAGDFIAHVLETICGFTAKQATWLRGSSVPAEWSRPGRAGENIKPRHLWVGPRGATLPVFIDREKRVGIGRGRKAVSSALQWLRSGPEQLALVTNGRQWRLVFAGLDFDASCELDTDLWFDEGMASGQVTGLRSLFDPKLWTPPDAETPAPLLKAILDSRKGQAELSQVLGERVREAVEILVQAHGEALKERVADVDPADIYRAAVRMVMRMVVVLFAESRGLLPRENPIYHQAYGLNGLREQLERINARGGNRLARQHAAWPRFQSLMRLIHDGSHHPDLPVPAYGGELFAMGDPESGDGLLRALHVLETACYDRELASDRDVHQILELITRTRVKIRQGRSATWMPAPVDFSDLSSEYIGILYEGLLDFELRTAPQDDPVVFLAVGNQPALPLSRLEAMEDKAIKALLEKLKDTSTKGDDEGDDNAEEADEESEDDTETEGDTEEEIEEEMEAESEEEADDGDDRHTTRSRAEQWARRAVEIGKLVKKPRGTLTPERRLQHEQAIGRKARQLVNRVVLPGEWYLVRWGGTRKGSGTFYTRPQLAVPTVHRTLRPLAFDPPLKTDGTPDSDALTAQWTPKKPEEILAIKVCDPACGSGSFPVAALRFLTDALFESVLCHDRINPDKGRPIREVLGLQPASSGETGVEERLPVGPDHEAFEEKTKAVLRRYVVERCIYGVDLDPLATELCRLALWIETMDRDLPFSFLDHKIRCGNALVGAWFDQFLHYPVMAWEREGGDKNHSNGVHFKKEAITKAIRERKTTKVKPDLINHIEQSQTLFAFDLADVQTVHDQVEQALKDLHDLPVHDAEERASRFRALRATPEFQKLRDAFDLWCAMWFWPGDSIDECPLPSEFARPSEGGQSFVAEIATQLRFFHWELEFPDVFRADAVGFHAVLGNPPWDTSKPNSKEFFSNLDPLYRSYGKQDAIRQQRRWFERSQEHERDWLNYNGGYRAMSNWVKYCGHPFGDRVAHDSNDRPKHDCNLGDRGRDSFASSKARHGRWKAQRALSTGYADAEHPFLHQGSGDINLYKMFLEQSYVLLSKQGRLGMICPPGIYSDHGARALRHLFIDRCRWEWLFNFDNREYIFNIAPLNKFNPIIVEKGATTESIRTAFNRHRAEDWEHGDRFAIDYPRERIGKLSPSSLALLELQSADELAVIAKIYESSTPLGTQVSDGWQVQYASELHMANDSKVFPDRHKWEEWGYRPDEYSRWIKGPWKPIAELWSELDIDFTQSVSAGVDIPEWAFDEDATEATREAMLLRLGGVTIRPGDVARTPWRMRCAQSPYDALPVPRLAIPEGIILSREGDSWIREGEIPEVTFTDASGRPLKIKATMGNGRRELTAVRGPAVATVLYQGPLIFGLSNNAAGFAGGVNSGARWQRRTDPSVPLEPQYLVGAAVVSSMLSLPPLKIAYRAISGPLSNERSAVPALLGRYACGHSINVLMAHRLGALAYGVLVSFMGSFVFDWVLRIRLSGMNISTFHLNESSVPDVTQWALPRFAECARAIGMAGVRHSDTAILFGTHSSGLSQWAICLHEQVRLRAIQESVVACLYGLDPTDLAMVLQECDYPRSRSTDRSFVRDVHPKGLWRVDRYANPEHRHTILTLVAFHDLMRHVESAGGDRSQGIKSFLDENEGEGWMLPETLRLADYGLGHDNRAKEHQPVRSHFGPRFFDWQLAQTSEDSWRECHLHARNLLGQEGYEKLQAELEGREEAPTADSNPSPPEPADPESHGSLFSQTD